MAHRRHHVEPPVYPPRGFYGHLDPEPHAAVPPRRKSRARSFPARLLALVVGAIAAVVVRSFLAGLDDPAVGDCVHTPGTAEFELVECGTAEAQFRIVGVEEGSWTQEQFEANLGLCTGFATTGVVLWEPAYRSTSGTIYCAEAI